MTIFFITVFKHTQALSIITFEPEARVTVKIIIMFIVFWTHGTRLMKAGSFETNLTAALRLGITSRSFTIRLIPARI